jgi:hypothetical protein
VLDVRGLEGLRDEVGRPRADGAHRSFDAAVRGDDDDGRAIGPRRELLEDAEAVHDRHLQVEQDEIRTRGLELG